MWNNFKTVVLLTALTLLLVVAGRALGGEQGMIIALALAVLMNFGGYWFSDKIVLAMSGARPADPVRQARLFRIVERLTQRANLPMPKVYIIPADQPNAFATGRSPHHAAVAVTEGLLMLLEEDEIEGVLGHELAHIQNRDMLIATIAATLAGAIMVLANMARWAALFGGFGGDDDEGVHPLVWLLLLIVAPLAALLIQLSISRSREYLADEKGARLCGRPFSLANALRKLEMAAQRMPLPVSPATAHLYIVNPLRGESLAALFSTHPPIAERIRRLEALALNL
ncbi:MAG TPA: protease HtpX [Armatimonadetes bacterium]|nr:protease HtpX [Armatimonadota bacterium]